MDVLAAEEKRPRINKNNLKKKKSKKSKEGENKKRAATAVAAVAAAAAAWNNTPTWFPRTANQLAVGFFFVPSP